VAPEYWYPINGIYLFIDFRRDSLGFA